MTRNSRGDNGWGAAFLTRISKSKSMVWWEGGTFGLSGEGRGVAGNDGAVSAADMLSSMQCSYAVDPLSAHGASGSCVPILL